MRKEFSKEYVFGEMPVGSAVTYLVVPTVLTQVISILYNLADTYFIGQLGDPVLVAAVGVCLPPMMILTALANLFGVGASSVISRALGQSDKRRAERAAAFALWGGIATALVYLAVGCILRDPLIDLIGGAGEPHAHAVEYLTFTFAIGELLFFLTSLLAHLLRSMSKSVAASVGVAAVFSLCMSTCFTVLVVAFPNAITAFFINDPATIECGRAYLREVALCFIPSGLVFLSTSYLQAIGQKRRPYILAFTRMGTVDVVLMIACSALLGSSFILLGKPLADWLCLCTAAVMLNDLRRKQGLFSK